MDSGDIHPPTDDDPDDGMLLGGEQRDDRECVPLIAVQTPSTQGATVVIVPPSTQLPKVRLYDHIGLGLASVPVSMWAALEAEVHNTFTITESGGLTLQLPLEEMPIATGAAQARRESPSPGGSRG
jgi:hypothetical protein